MGNFKDRLQKNPVLVDALLLTKFNDIQYRNKKIRLWYIFLSDWECSNMYHHKNFFPRFQ